MHQTRIPSYSAHHPHIDETAALPLQAGLFDTNTPWLVPSSWPDESESGSMPLHNRVMPIKHGRSAELTHDPAREESMRMYFADSFGHWYSVLNAKGNNTHEPHARYNRTLSPQWSVRGYMSDQYRMRCQRTSRLFREHDIDTEWPVYMKRPVHLILPDQNTPASRKELITYASTHQEQDPEDYEPNPDVVQEALAQLEPTVLVRAMKMSERIWDLPDLSDADIQKLVLTGVHLHNFDLKRREKDGSYDPRLHGDLIDTASPMQDLIDQFMTDALPRRIGRNVGLMHKLGVAHHYLHPGNITLMGEVVDLDSPTGHAVLGYGPDATMKERIEDIRALIIDGAGYAFIPLSEDADRERFYTGFFDAYCSARGLDPNSLESLFICDTLDLPSVGILSFLGEEIEQQYLDATYAAVVHLRQNPEMLVTEERDDMIVVGVDSSYETADVLFDQFWEEHNLNALCDRLRETCPKTQFEPADTEGFRLLMQKILKDRYILAISRTLSRDVTAALNYLAQKAQN